MLWHTVLVFMLAFERDIAERREPKAAAQCPVTIAQYGPGERWYHPSPTPKCAGAVVEAPNHIFVTPVKAKKP